MDPYTLLGLTPGVDLKAIKRAFRRLAMQWHPDRNPDPGALEHFKSLRAAYEILLAELSAAPAPARAQHEEPAPAQPRGADRHEDIQIDIEQACLGGLHTVVVDGRVPCARCGGSGEEALTHSRLCPSCHASGKVRREGRLETCSDCGGRGYHMRQTCSVCGGSGEEPGRQTLEVQLPPGIQPGDALRLNGMGMPPDIPHGLPGDLLLRIRVAPHPLYRLAGRDLVLMRPLSALALLLGGEFAVPHPGGVRIVALPPGPAQLREARIPGAGLPARGNSPAGDLVVQFTPVMPEPGREELQPLLQALQQRIAQDQTRLLPEVATWESLWLPPA